MSVHYQVEADFGKGKNWQRNFQKHASFETAEAMGKLFQKLAKVRIVEITETHEEVIIPLEQ